MTSERRIEEREALEVICALEDVERHDWLRPGSKPTPDLEVTIDGCLVTVEVTMHTSPKEQELWGAAEKMRSPERSESWPQKTRELSYQWEVVVDHRFEVRDRTRTLTKLVGALIPVLAEVESTGAAPEVMQQRANEILDRAPYNPNLPGPESSWFHGWLEAEDSGVDLVDFVNARADQYCGYWYPPDIADWVTDERHPRVVMVLGPPRAVQAGNGGVTVDVTTPQSCFAEAVNDLAPAIQAAIDHKVDRGQMANVTGKKWLVVALDRGNAAIQLGGLCRRTAHPSPSELDSVVFPGFDDVWVFSRTSHGKRHAVLRLSHSDPARCCTVPRATNAA